MSVARDALSAAGPAGGSSTPRKCKHLIVCFDGTTNLYDKTNTNVVQLVSFLKKDDFSEQLVYYQTGVGTYIKPSWMMPFVVKVAQTLDEGIAWDIGEHVIGGYEFLMANWLAGDKICLFGFSRGAYTARALAGMVHKVGLLPRGNTEQVPFAYRMYRRESIEGWDMSTGFKQAFCNDVAIDFVGVWDTVGSVGILRNQYLPFTASNNHIKTFRHALSLDERRCKFKANLWYQTPEETATSSKPGSQVPTQTATVNESQNRGKEAEHPSYLTPPVQYGLHDAMSMLSLDTEVDPCTDGHTDVTEVWFSGGHTDVGGGCTTNKDLNALSRIPLVWMIREAALNTGIIFDLDALKAAGIENLPSRPADAVNSGGSRQQVPSVAEMDMRYKDDVLKNVHDALVSQPVWWVLEVLPFIYSVRNKRGKWKRVPSCNFGRPRYVPPIPKVHISVKQRVEAQIGYRPAAKWGETEPEWVE